MQSTQVKPGLINTVMGLPNHLRIT